MINNSKILMPESFKNTGSWFLDFQIQITEKQLESMEFQHLFTILDDQVLADAPINASFAGVAEWTSMVGDRELTLGWDWYICKHTGEVHVLDLVQPRGNLKLIEVWGDPCSEHRQASICKDRLLQNFWHAEVYIACPRPTLM